MQFINTFMLFGLLAVAIPVIIHILNRRNIKQVDWGAMIFLQDSLRRRRRRVLLEEMLLLACRCLIPALVALALARPFIQPESQVPWAVVMPMLLLAITCFGVSFALWRHPRWRYGLLAGSVLLLSLAVASVLFERQLNLKRFGRGAQKDVIIIVDGSASMSMLHEGESNFDRACREAARYIEEAPRDTAFSLIIGGPVPQVLNPVPIMDRRVLRDTLEQLRPTQGTMQVLPALTAAAVTAASGHHAVKQIVIIGDGQAVGWAIGASGRWDTIRRIFEQLPTPPQVIWRTLPLPASIRNLAVTGITFSREIVGTDREVGVRVMIENTGSEAVTPEAVVLRVGETIRENRAVRQLKPGERHAVAFTHTFSRPGAAQVEARVVAHDDLPADDVYVHIQQVVDTLRVLVVDGDATGDFFRRGSTFLSLALRPDLARLRGTAGSETLFLLEADVESAARAAQRRDFGGYGVVVLMDAPELPAAVLAALAEMAAGGGGVWLLPGSRTRAATFNTWLHEGRRVLPLALGNWRQATGVALDPGTFTHEILRGFRTGSDLGGVIPLQYWSLEASAGDDVHVAGRLDTGEPFLAIRPLGRGTIALSAFPFDSTTSELPLRRSFVPFAHEVVYHLARPVTAELNIPPSDGATLLLAPQAGAATRGGSGNGLVGLYYRQQGWRGEPEMRIDPAVDFDWGVDAPLASIPNKLFTVNWRGTLVPEEGGRHTFSFNVDDRASLTLNGEAINDPVDLVAGRRYDIQVTFEATDGPNAVTLFWKPPRADLAVVPSRVLLPVISGMTPGLGERVQITAPDGQVFAGDLAGTPGGTSLRVARSLIPGLYSFAAPAFYQNQLAGVMDEAGLVSFSVQAGGEESRLEAVTPEDMAFLSDYISILAATRPDDVLSVLQGQSFGKEVWRMLAVAAFLLLIAEVVLMRWISIQRRMGEEKNVDFVDTRTMGSETFRQTVEAVRRTD